MSRFILKATTLLTIATGLLIPMGPGIFAAPIDIALSTNTITTIGSGTTIAGISSVFDIPQFATFDFEPDGRITRTTELHDVNRDGSLDIITLSSPGTNPLDGDIRWYENDGTGGFNAGVSMFSNNPLGNFAAGDLNNDSHIDLVVGIPGGAKVYLGDASQNMTLFTTLDGLGALFVDSADFHIGQVDNDPAGNLDVYMRTATHTYLYTGDGTGNLFPIESAGNSGSIAELGSFFSNTTLATGDLNLDGLLDYINLNNSTGIGSLSSANIVDPAGIDLITNSVDYNKIQLSSVDVTQYSGAIGDTTTDTYPEIIYGTNTSEIGYFNNNTDGTFDAGQTIDNISPYSPLVMHISDIDGDGTNDMIVGTNSTGATGPILQGGVHDYYYKGNGDGTFGARTNLIDHVDATVIATTMFPLQTNAMLTGDFNDDGAQDIALSRIGADKVMLQIPPTYSLTCTVSGPDDGFFSITGTDLELAVDLPEETATYDICIVSDDTVNRFEKNFTLTYSTVPAVTSSDPRPRTSRRRISTVQKKVPKSCLFRPDEFTTQDRPGEFITVLKLQVYLFGKGFYSEQLHGIHTSAVTAAIKTLQTVYFDKIISPWQRKAGTTAPTGKFLWSTIHFVNADTGCDPEAVMLSNTGITIDYDEFE